MISPPTPRILARSGNTGNISVVIVCVVGRGQGWCELCYNAQDSSQTERKGLAQNVNSAEDKQPWSRESPAGRGIGGHGFRAV